MREDLTLLIFHIVIVEGVGRYYWYSIIANIRKKNVQENDRKLTNERAAVFAWG